MKKYLVLIFSILFITSGCYDNIELDNLSIIESIGIDYIDNNYEVYYEILNDNKSDNMTDLLSYTVNGSGKTISEAFTNANYKVAKKPYFSHLKILILGENILNSHFEKMTDYLIRDTNIRDEFQVLIADNTSIEKILKSNSKINPVVTNNIVNLLETEKYNTGIITKDTFQNIVAKLTSNNEDIMLNSITLVNNEISLSNPYIFNKYNYVTKLSKEEASLFTLLHGNNNSYNSTNEYNNGTVTINIKNAKTKFEVLDDKIIIKSDMEAKIIENNPKFDLRDSNNYEKLNNDFKKIIEENIKSLVNKTQEYKSDIFGFQKIYYKKNNKDNNNLWETSDIEVKLNIKINAKGFIFEVDN